MAFRVAINGFGRLGRLVFTQLAGEKDVEIAAINDAARPELLAYLLKYDTVPGKYPFAAKTEFDAGSISFRGKNVKVCREADPSTLPWRRLNADLLLDCPAVSAPAALSSRDGAEALVKAGARRALLSVPAPGVPEIVFSLNEKSLSPRERVFSAASGAAGALALLLQALNSWAPVESALALALEAGEGPAVLPAEGPLRLFRGPGAGVVPAADERFRLPGDLFPGLEGKIALSQRRVPGAGASSLVLTALVKRRDLDAGGLNRAMKARSSKSFGYTAEELGSADLEGIGLGALFDAPGTLVLPLGNDRAQVQVSAWYDRESSRAGQIARLIKRLGELKEGGRKKPESSKAALPPVLPRKPLIKYPS
jgi:glyceraldehyde 3-phosphate dehydrogenase